MALIVEGCTVSDWAVVLANAVLTKDEPPYAIVFWGKNIRL